SFVGLNFSWRSRFFRWAIDLEREDSSGDDYGIAHADRMLAQAFAHFVDGEHAGANINVINLGLLERVQGTVLLPDKFDIVETEVARDDEVNGVGQVSHDRHQAFGSGLLHAGFSRGPIHHAYKLLRRETKGITDDACNPFVERVLQHGIARELEIAALRDKGDATTAA